MIRIVVATDAHDVIGAVDPVVNQQRFTLVPPALDGVMRSLYEAPILVGGAAALAPFARLPHVTKWALTRDRDWTPPEDAVDLHVHTDGAALARTLREAADEAVVIGGLHIFDLFTPYANHLDRVVTDRLVPGDLVYRSWRDTGFRLRHTSRWDGGVTEHYRRQPDPADRHRAEPTATKPLVENA